MVRHSRISGTGASISENLVSPEIDIPDPNKGIPVVLLRSSVRSDISEGEQFPTPESSGTGESISENRVFPEIGSGGDQSASLMTVDSGAADRTTNHPRETTVPSSITSDWQVSP